MRWSVVLGVFGLSLLACAEPARVQVTDRLNQMIPLIELGLPVLGIAHPPYAASLPRGGRDRGAGEAPPPMGPEPDLAESTRELVAYQLGDYELNTYSSKGGVRPEEGFERAAAYWDMTEGEYLEKADVWPLNPNGELLINVIIESKEGVANARTISDIPGVSIVTVGSGTLGGVFTSTNAEGERVRDQDGYDTAVAAVLAACKDAGKSCGYPANNPSQVEALMADGWDYFIMQRRNQDAFDAILTARRLSGRPVQSP
jgi:hypothetical protein